MKATEILEKLQNVFLSSENDEAQVTEAIDEATAELAEEGLMEEAEEVALEATEEVVEEAAEKVEETELAEEDNQEEEAPAPSYVTKDELSAMKNEILAAVESLLKDKYEAEAEVPAQLSEEVELSEDAEEISHSPESNVEEKKQYLYSQSRAKTTKDRVFDKLFNN